MRTLLLVRTSSLHVIIHLLPRYTANFVRGLVPSRRLAARSCYLVISNLVPVSLAPWYGFNSDPVCHLAFAHEEISACTYIVAV